MTQGPGTLARTDWFRHLFPEGIPALWCPPLTHYDARGAIDGPRIRAHLRFISPWVKGLLVPGSTGDGWELTGAEARQLLDIVLAAVRELKLRLLIGALRPATNDAREVLQREAARLLAEQAGHSPAEAFARARVCGFTVCPPRGAALSQTEIESGLSELLSLGLPLALYQLPQVTQNEMRPETVSRLAERFPNFILFKDTSGRDAVALSNQDFHGVYLVRGMEGQYDRWLKPGGGPYDGFLLCAANCFAEQLHTMAEELRAGQKKAAAAIASRLSAVIEGVFQLARPIPNGNVFANGGKAIDHFLAHGARALEVEPPRLHSGRRLPTDLMHGTAELLRRHDLMPAKGYLTQ